jgi:hypothetical protein
MFIDDFAGACTQTILRAPATLTADGNSAAVDCQNVKGKTLVTLAALNTAGSTPTLATKLQHAEDNDIVTSVTPGSNTGNGRMTQVLGRGQTVAENITISFTNATTFTVTGSVTGAMAGGTLGTLYQNAQIEFLITAGTLAFVGGDTFVIATTARVYADVPEGAFAGLTTGASMQKLQVRADNLGRWWRVNFDIGGSSSPAYTIGIAAFSLTD